MGLALGGSALVATGGARYALAAPRGSDELTRIEVAADPVVAFAPREPERRRFGALEWRSGIRLSSSAEGFGGLSGLWRSPDGGRVVLVTDNAQWLTADLTLREGRLAGLANVVMAPILGADGKPLRRTRSYDTEGLAIVDGAAYVSFERTHQAMRFDWGREGVRALGRPIAVPAEAKALPSNKSFEAIAVVPPRAPLAGAVVVIAEQALPGPDTPTRGWILTGPRRGSFEVARSDEFDITDLAFLPSGEMLLLERRFSLLAGVACRIRRIPADTLKPDARLDGPSIFEVDNRTEIDNLEAIALHRDGGRTIVTLVSDDNFSALQRTLMLEFELID